MPIESALTSSVQNTHPIDTQVEQQVEVGRYSVGDGHTAESLDEGRNESIQDINDADSLMPLELEEATFEFDTAEESVSNSSYKAGFMNGVVFAKMMIPGCKDADLSQIRFKKDRSEGEGGENASMARGYMAGVQAVIAVSTSKSDLTLDRVVAFLAEIKEESQKLNLQLQRLNSSGLKASDQEAGSLSETTLSMWDNLTRYGHQLKGAFSATVDTVGTGTLAVALPTVTSIATAPMGWTPTGIGINTVATGAGAYLVMSALRDFPELATNKAAVSIVESTIAKVEPLFEKLGKLLSQEKARQTTAERIALTSLERAATVDALQRELNQVSEAIETSAPTALSLDEFYESDEAGGKTMPQPATVGDGKEGSQTLSKTESIKLIFDAIFASIAESFASLTKLLSDLPNVFERARQQSDAAQNEATFTAAYKSALDLLAAPAKDSGVTPDELVRVMRMAGISKDEMGEKSVDLKRQLCMGENLMRIIQESEDATFGTVVVPGNETSDSYALPASLTLARALGSYFSMAAQDPGEDSGGQVVRNQDGSLSVEDPSGQLYNFLMGVPSAYTGSMAGLKRGETNASLIIDDHSMGFPGGASSMQFEHALKVGTDGKPVVDASGDFVSELRVRFLDKQPQPMFTPLLNEGKMLRSLYMTSIAEEQEASELEQDSVSSEDYSGWDLDRLLQRENELLGKLEHETALLQIDQNRISALKYWEHPEAQRFQ